MISLNMVVMILIYIIVAGAIDPPQPWRKVGEVALILGSVLVLIGILLSLVGGQPLFRP